MIKFLVSIFALFLIGLGSVEAQEMKLEKEVLDYGTIAKNSDGVRTLVIENVGDKPLIISNIVSTCDCTVPDYPKNKPILPGKSITITVKYDTSKVGPINKVVEIFSNDSKRKRRLLKVKGTVK